MSFISTKNEYFFPSRVFRCASLGAIVEKCCQEGIFALVDIADKVSRHYFVDDDKNKVFVVKCGNQSKDCIFTCEKHLSIILIAKRKYLCTENPNQTNITVTYTCNKKETYCTGCIRHYLKLMYHYFYFVDFDLKFS